MNDTNRPCFDILIVGGGPAGTGLLLKALKDGTNINLFEKRIALVEQTNQLVCGNLTGYDVNSDTLSDVFLECLEGATGDVIDMELLKAEIKWIQSFNGKSIPLTKLHRYLNKLGELLRNALTATQQCTFFMNTRVERAIQNADGAYAVYFSGRTEPVFTHNIVLATGGKPNTQTSEYFANTLSLTPYKHKIVHSDTLLKSGLEPATMAKLIHSQKVVILGGSHSGFSVAHYLLYNIEGIPFGNGDVQIWSTSQPKIYFNNRAEALASDYRDFNDDDFCPVTGKLYRLAGLRMDGRTLFMQVYGIGQLELEKRVAHTVYTNQTNTLDEQLKSASLIITAFGYQLNIIPFFDANGNAIQFSGSNDNHWVNDNCALLDENKNAIPHVYATGLATGFIPRGTLGGEPSFQGQTNGIWYYQNAIADLIMRNIGVVTV